MVVFPDLSIYRKGFTYAKNRNQRIIHNIFFNDSVKVCLNKSLLNLIESEVEDSDYFEAVLKELFDTDKIVVEKSIDKDSFDDQYLKIFQESQYSIFLPITIHLNDSLPLQKHHYIVLEDKIESKKNTVLLDLLNKNISSVSYLDFKDNKDIQFFFESLFSIPKILKHIYIFNRDLESNYLNSLKGNKINYYTLIRRNDIKYASEDKKEIMKILGRKINIFFTSNPRIIHERKIIFEDILITVDNAFENTLVEEPTWEIHISYNPILANKWMNKCNKFKIVHG